MVPFEDFGPLEGLEELEKARSEAADRALDGAMLRNLEELWAGRQQSLEPRVLENLSDLYGGGNLLREEFPAREGQGSVFDDIEGLFDRDTEKPKFDREAFRENIEAGADQWHEQLEPYSCAIASQHFIIREYTGSPVTERELIETASELNWYRDGGTPVADVGNLLLTYGIDVTTRMEGDFQDLLEATANGDRVLVSVQNTAMTTEWADGYPAYSANHVVEVLNVDTSDPENPRVIVNDPGIPNGRAMSMTRENFEDAWMTGGGYMCVAHRPERN